MKSALQSLALVTVGVLVCVGIAWLYMKSKASNQAPHKPLPNSFFTDSAAPLSIVSVSNLSPEALLKLAPEVVIWADIQITKDGKVVVLTPKELENPNFNLASPDRSPETKMKTLGVRYLTLIDVQKVKPETRLLVDLLKEQTARRFVLNVVDYAPGADTVFSNAVSEAKADQRIIFHSEHEGPLSDLRKLEPMWLFGTSRAQVVQTLFLTTLGLEGMAPLKGDVLITQLHAEGRNQNSLLLTPELLAEARRRSMKVLVGPVHKSEAEEARKLGVDGVISSDASEFGFP